ncbi:MAG: manganese catalase family protein, partial [Turicibacter sp.]|nr:manganese catalase family protein [Turicibacter sp.]
EIVSSMIYQLTDGATMEELKAGGLDGLYAGRGTGIFLADPEGTPWNAAYIDMKGEPISDIISNMSAEQRARAGYEHLLDLSTDDDVRRVLSYLREREVVHFQRFGETLMNLQDYAARDHHFFIDR